MHRLETIDRCDQCGQFVPIGQLYVADEDTNRCVCKKCDRSNAGPYCEVAAHIAGQPDHLAELVSLMTAIQRAGVDLVEHWDCLTAELVLGEME